MDIRALQLVINSSIPDEHKEDEILKILSKDESIILYMFKILEEERKLKKELISDMNLELSRAHIYIDTRPEVKSEEKKDFNKGYVIDKIAQFYIKYKDVVTHCFNRFN